MLRPNLFRCLTVFCVAVVWCAPGFAGGHPPGYWQVPGVHIPHSQYQAPMVDYYNGQRPQGWNDQQPVEHFLGELGKRSWMRFDYLHWSFAEPGGMSIGAPVLDLSDPLRVFDNQNGGVDVGVSSIMNTGNMAVDDVSGIRGTWGLDLANADFELEFFGTARGEDSFSLRNLSLNRPAGSESIGTVERPNVVVPLLSSGSAVDADAANYLIYDDSFTASLSSRMWGAEASLLSKNYLPGDGFGWQWLGGFRYIAYEEKFGHVGVFNNGQPSAVGVVTTVNADTVNNMYGPEVGARASLTNRFVTLSATPRIAFALNDYSGSTNINGTNVGTGNGIDFTPIVQVSFTGEFHVTPNFSVFGGYDLMWMYRMTRPFDNIVYNSTPGVAGAFDTDIRQEIDLESFYARGLSVGCVLRY